MDGMEKDEVKDTTVQEVFDILKKLISEGCGEDPFIVSVPYRDGMGFHYEKMVNISSYNGMVDMHVTVPDADDVKK